MDFYLEIEKISNDEKVTLGKKMSELLNKELCLGMTRYQVRNGSLSEGHEKITDAQRYYQCIREMYYLSSSIRDSKANSMIAQADLLDAKKEYEIAIEHSQKLRAEAKILRAEEKLFCNLVQMQDSMRILDEFTKVYYELKPIIDKKYPNGIEQSEPDNWEAVLKYRIAKNKMHDSNFVCHVPMDKYKKAKIGLNYGAPEAAIWLATSDEEKISTEYKGDIKKYLYNITGDDYGQKLLDDV